MPNTLYKTSIYGFLRRELIYCSSDWPKAAIHDMIKNDPDWKEMK